MRGASDVLDRHVQKIQPYLDMTEVSDVLLLADQIRLKRNGVWEIENSGLSGIELGDFAYAIGGFNGISLTNEHIATCRLPGKQRVQIVTPECSPGGWLLSIRLQSGRKLSLQDYVANGTFASAKLHIGREGSDSALLALANNGDWQRFLESVIQQKLNVAVVGTSGAGKTKLLSALVACIPDHENVLIAEEVAEAEIERALIIRGTITPLMPVQKWVAACVRMAMDRVLTGEVVDGAAYDLLGSMLAMPGQLFTLHAESVHAFDSRFATLARQHESGGSYTYADLTNMSASLVHVVIHIEAVVEGGREIRRVRNILFRGRQ